MHPWCSLICCQPNAITKIVGNLIWAYWILHFAFCVYIPYCILHTDYIAQPSSVAVETSNPGWIRAMWQPLNHWENLVCGNTLFKSKIDVEYQKKYFLFVALRRYWEAQNRILFKKRLETQTWSSHWEIKLLIEGCVYASCGCCRWCHWFCEQSSGVITSALSASPLTTSH